MAASDGPGHHPNPHESTGAEVGQRYFLTFMHERVNVVITPLKSEAWNTYSSLGGYTSGGYGEIVAL